MADKVEVQFGAQLGELTTAINQAQSQIESLTAPISSVTSALAGFGEAAGVAFAVDRVVEWAEKIAEAGERVQHTSEALGLSVEQVSRLNLTFQAMGIDGDRATLGLQRLAFNLNEAGVSADSTSARAFAALGISMASIKDLSLDQVMARVADAFARAADGPNKTAIAIALLGRAGAQMIPVLDRGSAGLAEFQDRLAATGAQLTGPMTAAMEESALNFHLLDLATQGLSNRLFLELKPAIDAALGGLTQLIEDASSSQETVSNLALAVEILVKTFTDLGDIVGIVVRAVEVIEAQFEKLLGPIVGFVEGYQTATLAGKGFFDAIAAGAKDSADTFEQAVAKQDAALAKIKADLADIFSTPSANESFEPEGRGADKQQLKNFGDVGQGRGAGSPAAGLVQGFRDKLDQRLIAEKAFFADSKAEELAYWQDKLAKVNAGELGVNVATKEGAQLRLEIERQVFALQKSAAQDWLRAYKAGIDEQASELKTQYQDGEISARDYYARLIALHQNYVDTLKQLNLEGTAQFQAALKQMEADQREATKAMQVDWKGALDTIQSAMDQMLTGVLRGTQTWQQAMARVISDLATSFIEAVAKMTLQWSAFQLLGIGKNPIAAGAGGLGGAVAGLFGSGGAGGAQNPAMQQLTAALTGNTAATGQNTGGILNWIGQQLESLAQWLGLTTATTAQTAATTAGAAATTSDTAATTGLIPAIAALTAAVAANTAALGASSIGSAGGLLKFPSFDVGAYRVPATMLAQIHEDEMIIPAAQAAQVRAGQAAVGAGGFAAGASGALAESGGTVINVAFAPTLNATGSAQEIANMLKNQGATIAQIVADKIAGGNSALKSALAKA